jgi:hypothetical protein
MLSKAGSIEKLRSDNYYQWSSEMTTHLEKNNLIKCIKWSKAQEYISSLKRGKDTFREEYEEEIRTAERKAKNVEEREEFIRQVNKEWRVTRLKWAEESDREEDEWKRADERCRGILKDSVTNTFVGGLQKCDTAFQMWEKLKTENEGTRLAHALSLKITLYRMQQGEEETLMAYLERIERQCLMIEALGEKSLDERERCFLIVGTLDPKRFDGVSQSLCLNDAKDFTLKKIRDKFQMEERREATINEGRRKEELANVANSNHNRKCRSVGCNRVPEGNYWRCKECFMEWKRKKNQDKGNLKNVTQTNNNTNNNNTNNNIAKNNNTVCNTEINLNNSWFVDSACTRHITNNVGDIVRPKQSNTIILGPTNEKSPAELEGAATYKVSDELGRSWRCDPY